MDGPGLDGGDRTPVALGLPAAYAAGIGSCAVASVLTVAYVGGGHAQEGNPVMVGLIELIGVHGAVVSRIALIAVLFWGYYTIATIAGVPTLGRLFAWSGAAIHVVDAFANLVAAATIGFAPVGALQLPTALAIFAVTGVAVAVRPPPIGDREPRRRRPAGAPR